MIDSALVLGILLIASSALMWVCRDDARRGNIALAIPTLILAVEYLFRPLVSVSGVTLAQYSSFALTLLLSLAFLLAFLAGRRRADPSAVLQARATESDAATPVRAALGTVIVVATTAVIIQVLGGSNQISVAELALRDEGTNPVLPLLRMMPVGWCVAVLVLARNLNSASSWAAATLPSIAVITSWSMLQSGGRSDVVILGIAAAISFSKVQPVRIRTLVSMGLIGAILLSGYRAYVREPFYSANEGVEAHELLRDAVSKPIEGILDSGDIAAYDRLNELVAEPLQIEPPGASYVALTRLLPGMPDLDSGSEILSRERFPVIAATGGAVGLSAAGEALANFGWWAVILAGYLLGLGVRVASRLTQRSRPESVLVGYLVIGRSAGIVRGDFFHAVLFLVIILISGLLSLALLRRFAVRAEPQSGLQDWYRDSTKGAGQGAVRRSLRGADTRTWG